MIEVAAPIERAVLVAAPRKGSPEVAQVDEHLTELAELVDTAGAVVVGRLVQQIASAHAATLIGEGKVEELRALIAASGATLAIFDEDLTPTQGQSLEEALGTRVMDRTEVILDIFTARAHTSEAKLQTELAQLQYLLPRLTRMWTHLSRIRGGIGLRGPGETQLETDRRMIRQRIAGLREKIGEVATHRATLRAGRAPALTASLIGYTNAGKSSLLRSLSGEHDILVEDRLFATLDTLSREVVLGEGLRVRVNDTVGFIRKLPHHLVASFRATFEESRHADLLLHVVDASHPAWEDHVRTVEDVLTNLELDHVPLVMVFNKLDAVEFPEAFAQQVRADFPGAIFTTTMRVDGLQPLKAELRGRAESLRPLVWLRLDPADGSRLSAAHRMGDVLQRRFDDGQMALAMRLEPWRIEQLRRDDWCVQFDTSVHHSPGQPT